MSGGNLVDLKFISLETETPAAWLLVFDEGGGRGARRRVEAWMPKSECELDQDGKTVTAPQWLVEKKELDGYAA